MTTFEIVNRHEYFIKLTQEEKLAVSWWIDSGLIKTDKSITCLLKEAKIFYSKKHKWVEDMTKGLVDAFKSDVSVYRDYKIKHLLES